MQMSTETDKQTIEQGEASPFAMTREQLGEWHKLLVTIRRHEQGIGEARGRMIELMQDVVTKID